MILQFQNVLKSMHRRILHRFVDEQYRNKLVVLGFRSIVGRGSVLTGSIHWGRLEMYAYGAIVRNPSSPNAYLSRCTFFSDCTQ